ncbi:hypothetical protein BDR07DRAFT_1416278 [Suillus spraguei]|nr:hypothetical protein BDR07DRAFT_1416278 [Suillus spraguei]
MFRVYSANERQEYIKFHKKIRIVVDLAEITTIQQAEQSGSSDESLELRPTTSEIFRKYWVGKSSLINHAFGVEKTPLILSIDRFARKARRASIDHEFISPQNDNLKNLKIVQDFIESRRKMSTPEHQLHAIWLCFQIPHAGGRLLETGTEKFLKLKSSGTLGDIPVVVVLTQYDMLIDRMERTIDETSLSILSNEAIKELAKTKAEAELQDICIEPLHRFAGLIFPTSRSLCNIAACKDHKETITHLIQITENCVGLHSTPEAAVMTSIAQRVHPGLKIKASIERYWKALASSTTFKNRKTWDCLYVLHTDIVNVWNFYDLIIQEFREMIVKMVDKLEVGPTANPTKTITIGLSMVGTIAGIVSALAGPAAPIVVPIAASAVLAVWVHDVYQISHAVLQRFMSYIVHLTLVLQTLYLVSESQELTRRVIKLAVASYLDSPISGEVVTWIQEYDKRLTILERADRDALDEIVEVMQFYSIDAAQMFKLRDEIPHVGSLPDEAW